MDFSIPERIKGLLPQVREFVRRRIVPLERNLLQRQPFGQAEAALEEIREEVKRRGWWLPQIARDQGGMGLSNLEHGLLSVELGRSPLGHYAFNCQAPDAGNMEILLERGSQDQKRRFLEPLLQGRIRSCFSMTEPERAGSNPVWLDTEARLQGDEYVINGSKWFTSSADGAEFAIVMAVTSPQASPHQRASMLIVPCSTPGFRIERNISCMGDPGDSWASHSEIRYSDCRVPKENLLGPEGAGFAIAQQRLGPGRIHHCMRWIGICERAFELMLERANRRRISPDATLAQQQFVQDWIATSRMEINAARLSVLHAAWTIDQSGSRAAQEEISCIKFQTAGVLQRTLDRAIQLHGALGVSDDTPLAWFYRHERAARIYDGPDEVHKMAAAKRILRRYASSKNEQESPAS